MSWSPGIGELIFIFLIVLLLFGGKKLPGLAKSIGSGINEFKKGLSGQFSEEDHQSSQDNTKDNNKEETKSSKSKK